MDTPAVLAKLLETEDIGQQYGVQWPARPAFIFPSTTQARASNGASRRFHNHEEGQYGLQESMLTNQLHVYLPWVNACLTV